MKSLPFPLRVAAGLAVSTAERVRELPKHMLGLPVTVASQVLQASMRVQQHITELAIKGDDALAALRPVDEEPSWATFDEDTDDTEPAVDADVPRPRSAFPADQEPGHNGHRPDAALPATDAQQTLARPGEDANDDPWAAEERALAEEHGDGEFDSADPAPAGVAGYDELTLPQLRARLRQFDLGQLEELLAYERAHADRPSFVGMLARRIGNVRREQEAGAEDPGER